jgi:hypothetical protein
MSNDKSFKNPTSEPPKEAPPAHPPNSAATTPESVDKPTVAVKDGNDAEDNPPKTQKPTRYQSCGTQSSTWNLCPRNLEEPPRGQSQHRLDWLMPSRTSSTENKWLWLGHLTLPTTLNYLEEHIFIHGGCVYNLVTQTRLFSRVIAWT